MVKRFANNYQSISLTVLQLWEAFIMDVHLNLVVDGTKKVLEIKDVYCIGYTGRSMEKTKEHIAELEDIGIPAPDEIPTLYPVRTSSLIQDGQIDVLGPETSGEVEIVFVYGNTPDEVYMTVGSDHTDRSLETVDINKSKQVCDKPIATKAWKLNDLIEHWDEIELSSETYINGKWEPYQSHKIDAIMTYEDITAYLKRKNVSLKNAVFFAGTVPLKDGFKYGSQFRMKIKDPVRKDEIKATYSIRNIERS